MNKLECIKVLKNPAVLCVVLFILNVLLVWPGEMSSDSQVQYNMAVSGIYNDHHPPLMAFLWHYLDKICQGSGLILVLHLALLHSSIYYLVKSFPLISARYTFLLLPWLPNVFVYSSMIWKDIGFTFCMLFALSFLTYVTSQNKKLKIINLLLLFCLLIYGSSVKFHGQYCAAIPLLWMVYIQAGYQKIWKKLFQNTMVFFGLFYLILNSINPIFIPNLTINHSWQYVKFYDLAAISVKNNQDYFPAFVKNPHFTLEELKNIYKPSAVDTLVFSDNALLHLCHTEAERQQLWSQWFHTIVQHPLDYLQHRSVNMAYILLSTPLFDKGLILLQYMATPGTSSYKVGYVILRILGYALSAHFLPVLLGFGYCMLSLATLRLTWVALPLLCFSMVTVCMTSLLFFLTMAGVPRYTYICVCLVHASHLLAYRCWQARCK